MGWTSPRQAPQLAGEFFACGHSETQASALLELDSISRMGMENAACTAAEFSLWGVGRQWEPVGNGLRDLLPLCGLRSTEQQIPKRKHQS